MINTIRPPIARLFSLLRKRPFPIPSPGLYLPLGILIDKEISLVYNSRYFYLAQPRGILADRYQTLIKAGWGGLQQYGLLVICNGNFRLLLFSSMLSLSLPLIDIQVY